MSSIDYEIKLLRQLVEINTNSVTKMEYDECAFVIMDEAEKCSLNVEVLNGEKAAKADRHAQT